MKQFYRRNIKPIDNKKSDIDIQIIEWWAQDEEDDDDNNSENSEESNSFFCKDVYTIRCFGVTSTGVSVTCKIKGFTPFYYIKVNNDFNSIKLKYFLDYINSHQTLKRYPNALVKENGKYKSHIVEKKDLFGFRNNKTYKFVKLIFNNYTALMKSRYIFKKAINIQRVTSSLTKFKLYESNFEGFMRYCHIKNIRMAGWIRLPKGKYQLTSDSANTQLEFEIDRKNVESLSDKQDMAPFLQASWDIEVYSHDYTFPDPKIKANEIFQIATTYKYYGDKDTLIKHLLTLKKCSPIDDSNVIVEECKNEKELIKKWVDTINNMDPDIFYTYNGDSFDCTYLIERAKIYGLISNETIPKSGYILNQLSRLQHTPCVIKKEVFSSSAYGDSEFTRLYIPGRLNYDLLIHYKRGMKKYPSYKLDFIANEILKEGKHDVSAKEIFKYYEEGTPDKIKHIGSYCIQDTELLQKLVDKQLILITIMQLANVTFVPIGFLTTRGQTIKVFSQLIRKSRQMDFLVPHTNFNEDSYPITLKFKDTHPFSDDDIGNYIQLDLGMNDNTQRRTLASAKIDQILDESTIITLCDTELNKEYYNRKMTFKRQEYNIHRLFPNDDAIDDSFTGATVLEAKPSMYHDNVAVLDFASLYPTIQISRNLCYSTYVMDNKYMNIDGVKYETIAWDDQIEYKIRHTCDAIGKSGKSKGIICGKQAYFEVNDQYFCRIHDPVKKDRSRDEKFQKRDVTYNYTIVQPHKNENGEIVNKGVLPALLEELYSERKKVKKQMAKAKEEGNKLLADILDSTQLAIKVSLNSCYGFLGRAQGNLICKPLGQLTTAVGRMLIEQSKEYTEGIFMNNIKTQKLITHQLTSNPDLIKNLTNTEKNNFLQKNKIN
jgi:DNA polymerase elongation subunit (family B)